MRAIHYLPAYTVPLLVCLSMTWGGWYTWLPVAYIFVIIPLADILAGRNEANPDPESEARMRDGFAYSAILWGFIPVQFALIFYFGYIWAEGGPTLVESSGMVLSLALSNGGIGITIAHELVHRKSIVEQWLGRLLLMSVLYMHFAIEHVRGHHALVATDEDPATARKGQSFYAFLFPSILGQYQSAWKLERDRLRKMKLPLWSAKNEMLVFAVMQGLFLAGLGILFGWGFAGVFALVSFLSFSLLEAVNYIEHYGLMRRQSESGRYEKVQHHHSWNSDHIVSRMFLFELTRHSDHHAIASRKYQVLRSHEDAPELPTGYPGMILLALFPPAWFAVMDPLVDSANDGGRGRLKQDRAVT